MDGTKCNGVTLDNKPCRYTGKFLFGDKLYCKTHLPKVTPDVTPTVIKDVGVVVPLYTETIDVLSKAEHDKNIQAKEILVSIVCIIQKVFVKFAYLLVLLISVFVVHSYAKSYYYNNCDSNLLKSWMFKRSPTCVFIGGMIQSFEAWSFESMTTIVKYGMAVISEIPGIVNVIRV